MATQALVAGDPPIVNIGTVVQASLQGYNLVLVAAVETKYDQIVFARKGINKLEELKGKKFGISGLRLGDPQRGEYSVQAPQSRSQQGRRAGTRGTGRGTFGRHDRRAGSMRRSSPLPPPRRRARLALSSCSTVADLGVEVQGNGFATSRSYIAE